MGARPPRNAVASEISARSPGHPRRRGPGPPPLAPVASTSSSRRAAAGGRLRDLIANTAACADPSTERALLALADRPQAVRHVLRAPLDWTDPALWDVHRALVEAFDADTGDLVRLAGVSTDGLPLRPEAADLWTDLLEHTARTGRLEALLDVALEDAAMADHRDRVAAVREHPWRVDASSRPPRAPRTRAPAPLLPAALGRRRAGPPGALTGLLAVAVAVAVLAGAAAGTVRVLFATQQTALRGTFDGPRPARPDARRRARPVRPRGAPLGPAPPRRRRRRPVDPSWQAHVERSDRPCPPRDVPLDPDGLASLRWDVAWAEPFGVGACRLRLHGLSASVGDLVELDAGQVQPRRFAVVTGEAARGRSATGRAATPAGRARRRAARRRLRWTWRCPSVTAPPRSRLRPEGQIPARSQTTAICASCWSHDSTAPEQLFVSSFSSRQVASTSLSSTQSQSVQPSSGAQTEPMTTPLT
ncbi:MAG: effector-associated domain EAD1-containing protein [Myxococcota bacterium]